MHVIVQERFKKLGYQTENVEKMAVCHQRMRLFILILIVNLCVVLMYLIWNHIRRKEKAGKCLDEGGDDASVSGYWACIYFALLLSL